MHIDDHQIMLSVNMLIENLRENVLSDGVLVRQHLEEAQRLLKINVHSLSETNFEAMDVLQGQLQKGAQRMKVYDRRWYELHGDLKGIDDCYKVVFRSKEIFKNGGSPMYLAALAEDMVESLRARIARYNRHLIAQKRSANNGTSSRLRDTVSIQYTTDDRKVSPT
ncbi:hypothetical protein M3Y94_00576600 [Aphelenchoides besseyi]|nr:hypothetical protein M3Y94_00576600 [Aphelenchoides besseyi]